MPPGEHLGDEIGPYRLLSILGEGGFGIVYLAERRSPYVQRVALKVIKPGMDSRAVIARFEQERQSLAVLDHPNIARILDAGTTPQGRPFFAMEYVPGEPIAAYAHKHALSIPERVAMVASVCDAVHHAHAHGLVHRDLTPANVLVTQVDGKGFPRIIDFGIARALSHTLSRGTLVTGPGVSIGTPEYMSPEQAEGEEVGPASDIYTLGVLLHELVTGSLPYPVPDLRRRPAPEVRRIVTQARVVPARRVAPGVSPDLETVILRALAREPGRRYRSAAELAEDLRHTLADEPILARRDSVAYLAKNRLRSLAIRQPLAVLAFTWVLTAIFVQQVLTPALFKWTRAAGAYERMLAAVGRRTPAEWSHVRAITLDDATPVTELAALAGVEGVTGPRSSLRAVHAELMRRLSNAGPAVVAWDINFAGPAPTDDALAAGFEALRARRIPWVTAVRPWPLDESGELALSPRIVALSGARWGGISADVGAAFLYVHLFAQRAPARPVPSLALGAYAAYTRPGWDPDLTVDADADAVEVVYSRPRADEPRLREHLPRGQESRIVAAVQPHAKADAAHGLRPDDLVGLIEVRAPANASLARTTISYADALRRSPDELRRFAEGRIIVIGDARTGSGDLVTLSDGSTLPGTCYMASAIEQLVQGWAVSRLSDPAATAWTALAAALGTILGSAACRRRYFRWGVEATGLLLLAAASVAMYAFNRTYANPMIPMVAWVVACELAALVRSPSAARSAPQGALP